VSAKKMTIQDYALQAVENGLAITPLVAMGKKPWMKGWQEAPITSAEKVFKIFAERPQSNYGIVTGYDGLFSVDLDGAEAISWWKDQGFTPGAEVKTPRGGMHVYYRAPEGIEVQTNAGKIHPKVDIRGVGGQCVGPGSMVPIGSYRGDIVAIANAPEAQPELMEIIPEKSTYTQVEYTGEVVAEASSKERQSVAWIVGRLQALPEKWTEGAGWHAAVFESAGWLARMANSGAYAMNEDSALTILLTYAPTYGNEWGDDKILEQWQSAVALNVGRFAETPLADDDIPRMIPLMKAQEGVPEYDSQGRQFMDLVWNDAPTGTEGARWDRRKQIFLESFRAGLDMQKAFSLAAGSLAGEALMHQHDARFILFKEAKKAHALFLTEKTSGLKIVDTEYVAAVESVLDRRDKIALLDDAERELLLGEGGDWWGTRYTKWVRESVKLANMPYSRLHLWMVLSVVFGREAYVPKEGRKLGMNLWGIIIGETSTGKTDALEMSEGPLDAYFKEDNPNLGSDATTEALHDALIGRDGKASYQVVDEAHGLLGELSGKGFRGDLLTRWTEFYDGKVRATLRSTKKEISGKSATTSFSLLLQGTTAKMARVMTTEMWEQGFLARSLFVIGDNITPDEADLDIRLIAGDASTAYNLMPDQFAGEFRDAKYNLRRFRKDGAAKDEPFQMQFEDKALKRLNDGMRRMRAILKEKDNQVALKPYANRFPDQVLKMSSLVALIGDRGIVEKIHVLIALHAAEEFLEAAIEMARLTLNSDFARQVDDIESFVASRGGKVDLSKIYRHLSQPAFEVNRLLDQLIAERRAIKRQEISGEFTIALIQDERKQAA
jgi:hypothetical protein